VKLRAFFVPSVSKPTLR